MNLEEARQRLYSKTFLIGAWQRSSALKYLAHAPEIEAMDILAGALGNHARSEEIRKILLAENDGRKIDRLWQIWAKSGNKPLGDILGAKGLLPEDETVKTVALLKLGRVDGLQADRAGMKRVFDFIKDLDADVRAGVIRYAGGLPQTEDAADVVYGVWLRTGSDALMGVIGKRGLQPTSAALEALFYLVSGQVEKYSELKDREGQLFQEAYALASAAFRQKVNETVLKSGDSRLVDAYERALSHKDDFDREVYVGALKTAENEEGLFDAARFMELPGLLDLCRRWNASGWRPQDDRKRGVADRAVSALKRAGELRIESDTDGLPRGVTDLFTYWKKTPLDDRQTAAGLDSPDPFARMRSLYAGHLRGTLALERLAGAAKSADWPERLMARLISPPSTDAGREPDHVEWVNACTATAEFVQAKAACTPEEFEYFGRVLKGLSQKAGGYGARLQPILEILNAFQSYYAASGITVAEDDSARERGAVQVSDMEDAPADEEF